VLLTPCAATLGAPLDQGVGTLPSGVAAVREAIRPPLLVRRRRRTAHPHTLLRDNHVLGGNGAPAKATTRGLHLPLHDTLHRRLGRVHAAKRVRRRRARVLEVVGARVDGRTKALGGSVTVTPAAHLFGPEDTVILTLVHNARQVLAVVVVARPKRVVRLGLKMDDHVLQVLGRVLKHDRAHGTLKGVKRSGERLRFGRRRKRLRNGDNGLKLKEIHLVKKGAGRAMGNEPGFSTRFWNPEKSQRSLSLKVKPIPVKPVSPSEAFLSRSLVKPWVGAGHGDLAGFRASTQPYVAPRGRLDPRLYHLDVPDREGDRVPR